MALDRPVPCTLEHLSLAEHNPPPPPDFGLSSRG